MTDVGHYCPKPRGPGYNAVHCWHLAGSNAPPMGTPNRRVEQIRECCWCGGRQVEVHGPYLKDCKQVGVSP